MASKTQISIRGAREHNLKNVDIDLPRDQFVVVTGLSGSGKSSLAFDTIYAEGQRRYVESLSSYARQFLGQMEKPKYDTIRGLSPTISIEQKAASSNPRSTVGTVTEVHDYLRVLYASIGVQHCHNCGRKVGKQSAQQIVDEILKMPSGSKLQLLAPLITNQKGEHKDVLPEAQKRGFTRERVDGKVRSIEEKVVLDKKSKHDIELVYTYFRLTADNRLLLGGGSALTTFLKDAYNNPGIIKRVIDDFYSHFPQLRSLAFIQFWPGQIDTTRDLLPTIVRPKDQPHLRFIFEDLDLVSPQWRPHLLAAAVHSFWGSERPDLPVIKQVREALRKP